MKQVPFDQIEIDMKELFTDHNEWVKQEICECIDTMLEMPDIEWEWSALGSYLGGWVENAYAYEFLDTELTDYL